MRSGFAGRATGESIDTLDGVERSSPAVGRRHRRRHRRARRHRRGHGRRLHRDLRHDHRGVARVRLVGPHDHRPQLARSWVCAARPRPASSAVPTPRSSIWRRVRLAELLAPSGAPPGPRRGHRRRRAPGSRQPVAVRQSRVNGLLGTTLSAEEISGHLAAIGFGVEHIGDDPAASVPAPDGGWSPSALFSVTVPTFRPDTTTETDVIEEIARHHGYSRIPTRVPTSVQTGSLTPRQRDRRRTRQILVGLGLDEAMPLPFLAPGDLARCGLAVDAVTVTNPLAAEESILRTSLRPGLLKAVAYNESHRTEGAALFEVGKVFGPPPAGQTLPDEREHLGVVVAGSDARGRRRDLGDPRRVAGAARPRARPERRPPWAAPGSQRRAHPEPCGGRAPGGLTGHGRRDRRDRPRRARTARDP